MSRLVFTVMTDPKDWSRFAWLYRFEGGWDFRFLMFSLRNEP